MSYPLLGITLEDKSICAYILVLLLLVRLSRSNCLISFLLLILLFPQFRLRYRIQVTVAVNLGIYSSANINLLVFKRGSLVIIILFKLHVSLILSYLFPQSNLPHWEGRKISVTLRVYLKSLKLTQILKTSVSTVDDEDSHKYYPSIPNYETKRSISFSYPCGLIVPFKV